MPEPGWLKDEMVILEGEVRDYNASQFRREYEVRPQAPYSPKDVGWLRVCLALAAQSKCVRAQYGSLILGPHGEPVAFGYNGKPRGSCNDSVCYREGLPPDAPKAKCCLHSEQNAVAFADYSKSRGGTFYVSGVPCEDCALLIMQSGVARLVCVEDERGYPGLETIQRYGVALEVIVVPAAELA